MKKSVMNVLKMFKNPQFVLFVVIGVIIYCVYSANILNMSNNNVVLKEKIVHIEEFVPKPVSYNTKESKYYEKELKEIQEKNSKTHKKGALYLKHTVSDTFDVEKEKNPYTGWSNYYKSKYKDVLKHDEKSGENLKDICHPVLKYDGIHRI